MKLRLLLAVVTMGTLLTVSLAEEKGGEKKAKKKRDPLKNVKCLISGKPISKTATVDYKGGKVYLCCGNCVKAFTADQKEDGAKKFNAKANFQLFASKQARLQKCVFTCKKLNKETVIEVAGTKVCFCCANCKKKAEDAEDKVAAVFGDKQFANGFVVGKKKGKKGATKEK